MHVKIRKRIGNPTLYNAKINYSHRCYIFVTKQIIKFKNIMRKRGMLVAVAAMAMAMSVNAQKAYEGTKFFDNWYVCIFRSIPVHIPVAYKA